MPGSIVNAMTAAPTTKAAWRSALRAARWAVTADEHAAEATALATAVETLRPPHVVCAYVPFGAEPGSTDLLDALRAAGSRVLLPVTGGAAPLRWAEYEGAERLAPGRFGIPTSTAPPRPASAIAAAGLVLVPALAVDRRGVRLGRGAGYYDRTLGGADPKARLVAVVRDTELVDRLPEERHDHRMGWALTPNGGIVRLGAMR